MANYSDQDQLELSSDQTEKLLQFQDLTSIEDLDRCRRILQSHNWSIEAAVQDRLNEEEGVPPIDRPQPPVPRVHSAPSNSIVRLHARERTRPLSWWEWGWSWIAFPVRFFFSTFADIFRFAVSLFRPDPIRRVTDPMGDVMSFIENYDEKYGELHPVFYRGTYSQGLTDAKNELRFFLVYLHSEENEHTDSFCRETLSNPAVIDYINQNTLFWACCVKTPEGYRVSQALRESTYPFLALIVLRDARMTVVARLEGSLTAESLLENLTHACQINQVFLDRERNERTTRNVNEMLRKDQDEAYRESLAKDREKARLEKEKKDREAAEEAARQQAIEDAIREKEEIEKRKKELVTYIPEEPVAGEPNSVKIMLKLPNGTRLERRFLKTHSLKYLYYFVFCNEEAPDDFEIVSNFPRKQIPCRPAEGMPEPPSFESVGLGRAEMLFVHDNTS